MTEDAELLSRYAADQSEAAFAELTRRHLDLVHSAALRLMNGDVHAAEDVTQQVFTEVARQAKRLARHPALVGWLYTTTRQMASRRNRTEHRRQAREQEAHMMNQLLHDDPPATDWNQLRPVIEDAMHELNDRDRHAVLLRYFQNKSHLEVAATLNLTESAARMCVDRALDKLRGKLARHGITTTAAALATVITTNAVQAAPAGLVATISAAAVAGSAVQASTLITATKTIAMTTLQKTIIAAALAVAVGTGIYVVHQGAQLHGQIQSLEDQQSPLAAQVRQLQQEREQTSNQLAALQEENARLRANATPNELLKLRGQVGALRQQAAANEAKNNQPASGLEKMMNDPNMKEFIRQAQKEKIRSMYADLFKELKLTPEQTDQFLQIMGDMASKSMEQITTPGTPNQSAIDALAGLGRQLYTLLGDQGMARFKDYSDEIPARTTVTLLNGQLGDNPLTAEQSAQLLQIVKAEPADLTKGITGAPDKVFLGSPSDIDAFLQRVAESNQHILQQAGSFLTPDQLAALAAELTKAVEARKIQAAALIQKH